jgi:hypothetical protein
LSRPKGQRGEGRKRGSDQVAPKRRGRLR